ncbi:MAG TPA: hypothetical protein VIV40_22175 [Kofleriaceae bacterium]
MRFAGALLALCSCNQIFGLDKTIATGAADATYFDAPADAPFACPPVGMTPQFSRLFHQIPQRCTEWSSSQQAGRAIAMCFEPAMQIGAGPYDGPLELVPGLETVNKIHFDAPRMTPEGDQVVIRDWNESTVVGRIGVYQRTETGLTYSHEIKLPNNVTTDSFVRYGSPSRGPVRRMFARNNTGGLQEIEVDASGASNLVRVYTEADFGVTSLAGLPPSMTPDGLRIVFYAAASESGIFYSDRASVNESFRAATLLMNVPGTADAFMTENCERIYFSALGSVLWIQRL